MIVMKFGGTSVQNEENIERVISIVKSRLAEKPLVVVSALARVTRKLVEMAEEAEAQHTGRVREIMQELKDRHEGVCRALLSGDLLQETLSKEEETFQSLSQFVEGVCQIGELSQRSRARIIGTGEILSSIIVNAALNANGVVSHWVEAQKMISTDDNYLSARPDLNLTKANVMGIVPQAFKGADVVLTQGFVASTLSGVPVVLGFEGSDYSAAILGMALDAERVEIWTDVNGIRTTDPRVVDRTFPIERISYEEASEMAYLGARVLHPLTIEPASKKSIPIVVLNTMNPSARGTFVVKDDYSIADGPKSVAFRTDIDYMEITARRLTGVAKMLEIVFSIIRSYRIKVSLVSVSQSKVFLTLESGQPGFGDAFEKLSEVMDVMLYRDRAQISIVGKKVALVPGLADRMLEIAGKVDMFTHGADMMSISAVVMKEDAVGIVGRLHESLFGAEDKA